jgi:hypothetical protein
MRAIDRKEDFFLEQSQEPCLARIFILGAARSGTSVLTSLLSKGGFFMGDNFYLPREANPMGFFEDREVNAINEALIAPHLPARGATDLGGYAQDIPTQGQRWLARLEVNTTFVADLSIQERIKSLYRRGATCFKDPRFCYTLKVWKQCLSPEEASQAKHLCIFRHPSVVISSVLKEVRSATYLSTFAISVQQAFENWALLYRHVLEEHSLQGLWHFVEYESLFTEEGRNSIKNFLDLDVDAGVVKAELNRSKQELEAPAYALEIYRNLTQRI